MDKVDINGLWNKLWTMLCMLNYVLLHRLDQMLKDESTLHYS